MEGIMHQVGYLQERYYYYVKKCANLTLHHAMKMYGGMKGMIGFMFCSLAVVLI